MKGNNDLTTFWARVITRWQEREVCSVSALWTQKKGVFTYIAIKYPPFCLWNHVRHLLSIFIIGNLHLLHWTGTEEVEENHDIRVKIRSSHNVHFHLSQLMHLSVSEDITYALCLSILKLLFSTQSSADHFKLVQIIFVVQLFCLGATCAHWFNAFLGRQLAHLLPRQSLCRASSPSAASGGLGIDPNCFWGDSVRFLSCSAW